MGVSIDMREDGQPIGIAELLKRVQALESRMNTVESDLGDAPFAEDAFGKIKELEEQVNTIDETVDELKVDVNRIDLKVDDVEDTADTATTTIDRIDSKVDEIDRRVDDLEE